MNVMKMTSSTKNMKTNKKGLQETKIRKSISLYTKKITHLRFWDIFFAVNKNHLQDSEIKAAVDKWS